MAGDQANLPDGTEYSEFLQEFQRESDRAAAVLAAAYLDDLLRQLLLQSFVDESEACKKLVEGERALGTFSARIGVCYAMGLISHSEREDLDQLRWIRNRFAHRLQGLTFGNQSIADRCRTFKGLDELKVVGPLLKRQLLTKPRQLFNVCAAILSFNLHRRVLRAKRRSPPRPLPKVPPRKLGAK